jgi:LacI family transcriptional regulator/LacI family repressor for deo operon, udp, cdd, tsx, nupC, and nupG
VQWTGVQEYRDYHQGVCARAGELGYKVVIFNLPDYEDNAKRLAQVFRTRNIQGAFVCPQPRARTVLNVDLSDVAAVTFGYTVQSPALHAVTSHHHRSTAEAFRSLRALGYRRIGYAIPAAHDERLEDHLIAGTSPAAGGEFRAVSSGVDRTA